MHRHELDDDPKELAQNAFSLLHSGARMGKHRLERQDHICGEVPEWSNGAVSKTVVLVIVPWVRIPPSPPFSSLCIRMSARVEEQHFTALTSIPVQTI